VSSTTGQASAFYLRLVLGFALLLPGLVVTVLSIVFLAWTSGASIIGVLVGLVLILPAYSLLKGATRA
jgi:ABC-type transport system involved in cytochrome bd biosynthesis fused ATPase/permease subunit